MIIVSENLLKRYGNEKTGTIIDNYMIDNIIENGVIVEENGYDYCFELENEINLLCELKEGYQIFVYKSDVAKGRA